LSRQIHTKINAMQLDWGIKDRAFLPHDSEEVVSQNYEFPAPSGFPKPALDVSIIRSNMLENWASCAVAAGR